jgi:pimeloyl-ACP methyl ester carboxylesterase
LGDADDTARPRPHPTRVDKGISVLNAVLGDHLESRRNDLAIRMECRVGGGEPTPKLCVLVHGLGCTEDVFEFPGRKGDSYGTFLRRDLGYTPVTVRYNTGLAIERNGRALSGLLDDFVAAYPVPVEEIALVGHSMGGLVLESACRLESRWAPLVRHVVGLGAPHEGADLEKITRAAADVLGAGPGPITRLVANVLNIRSRGVKDLGDGGAGTGPVRGAWPAAARRHVVAGTLTADPSHPVSRILGDALVRVPGAGAPDVRVFPGVSHFALAHDAGVYEQIRAWLDGA